MGFGVWDSGFGIRDLRFGRLRVPSGALVSVLTLALGVGTTTTIFGVVYGALLRPLPFPAPDRLVMLYTTRATSHEGPQRLRWSHPEISALGSRVSALEDVASFTQTRVNLTDNGDPEQVDGEIVSPGYLHVLHIAPAKGRNFLPDEDTEQGGHPVALISSRLWRARFASDPSILGRSLGINQIPLVIVGVMPEGFSGVTGRADVWIPTTMAPRLTYADYLTTPQHFINVIGRLRTGTSVTQGSAELAAIAPHVIVAETDLTAEPATWGAMMRSLGDARIDPTVRRSSLLLLAAAVCVLLIACVNVASVQLARARTRRREIAVRLAIGSSRIRIVRQLLTESLLLAAIGGALGTLLAVWGSGVVSLPAVAPSPRNDYGQLSGFAAPAVDGVVLLFALGVTIGTSLLFGLAPALELSRPDLVVALKENSRTAPGGNHRRVLAGLVVGEMALAVLLLAAAGLLLKSFEQVQGLRTGFVPDGVVTFSVNPPASRYPPAAGPAIIERLLTRIEQVPGVATATADRCTPFTGCARTIVFFPEHSADAGHAPTVGRHYVSSNYFRTLGIPIQEGRALTDQDGPGRPPVAVINETAARRFWPGQSPIGKHVWFGSGTGFTSPDRPVEVVGVAGDVKYEGIEEPLGPAFYTSYRQFAYPDTMVIVKTDRSIAALVPLLRRAVASVDAGLPIFDVQRLDDRIAQTLARPRFTAALIGLFAAAALLLAAAGVYGIMAYSVSFRSHEIGIRLALGADARRVLVHVLGESARLAAAGAVVGLAAASVVTRLMRSLLFGVTPLDPLILSIAALVIIAVALAAALVPAHRASAVDPMVVLRND
jgi:putative ABC transport system permease protein